LVLVALSAGARAQGEGGGQGAEGGPGAPVGGDIRPQLLTSALTEFADKWRLQVVYLADVAKGVDTRGADGSAAPEAALGQLLADTGLEYRFINERTVAIEQPSPDVSREARTHPFARRAARAARTSPGGERLLLAQAQPPAREQSATPPARESARRTGFVLEEVTVTARRVEENLQDTPISIAAFTGEQLDQRQIFETDDIDMVTPNMQFSSDTTLAGNNSSSTIFIRGIGQTDPTATVDPGVGLYIDDVYIGQSVGATMDLRDIGSVQVLRGPQGTLFGRNTIGGALVLTTRDPGDEFGGDFRVRLGSDNLRDAFVAFDAPGSDGFRSRFTFGSRTRDGYVTRPQTGEDLGDTDAYTAAGKLTWTPSDTLELRAQFDYTHADENGIPFVFAASNETATFQRVASADAGCPGIAGNWLALPAVPMITDDRCANDFQNKGPYSNNGTHPLESKLDNLGASFHVRYALSDTLTLKSITAYRSIDWEGIRDADNTPLTILHTDYDSDGDQVSQELQLLYTGERLTGVGGLYWFDEEIDDIVVVELNTPVPGVQLDSDNNITENSSWAVFTQWSYDISEQVSFAIGGRYTEDTKGSIPDQFNYADPSLKYLPVQLYEDTFDAFTGSASLSYRWSDNAMAYVSYAEGFKGGGWNSHFNRPQTPDEQATFQKFEQEEAETFELGVKLDLLDDRLRLNGALFTTDYTDLQFTYRVGVAPYLANAGEASIDGFEIEATWIPSDAWIVTGGVGRLDSSIDVLRDIAGIGSGVAIGNKLPFAPEIQANFGLGYIGMLGNGMTITPRIDVAYQDETFFDANNTPEIAQLDSFTAVNLSLALEPASEDWRLTIGATNATDELYAVGGNSSLNTGSGYAEIAYARPRQYFVGFDYRF
jgi:iron complex outermembrane receptor protein